MRNKYLCLLALVSLFAAAFAVAQQSGKTLLEQGRAKKSAGDLQGAMEAFETVVSSGGAADRNAAANALLELGSIAESLGQATRARGYFERVRNDFKDQAAEAEAAVARLKAPAVPTTTFRVDVMARTPIRTPYTDDVYSFAISPDGRTVVFQATTQDGKRQLWRQSVDPNAKPEPIAGTEGAGASSLPFFSTDGKSVAYFARQKFWQIDLAGGVAKELADAAFSWGGTWRGESIIVSARGASAPLEMVKGGKLTAVTSGGSGTFVTPHFVDDRRFLYFARNNRGTGTVEFSSLDGPVTARGIPQANGADYGSGYLVYVTQTGSLSAIRFDAKDLTTSGAPIVVADKVGTERRNPGFATFAVSASGAVAYRESAVIKRQMMWMDRNGELVGTIGVPDEASPQNPRLSPDGRTVLTFRQMATGAPIGSIWATDTATGAQIQIQDGATAAAWSSTGDRLLMGSLRTGPNGPIGPLLSERPLAGAAVTRGLGGGNPAPVQVPVGGGGRGRGPGPAVAAAARGGEVGPASGVALPEDWSSNGDMLYKTGPGSLAGNGGDLFVLPKGQGSPVPVAQSLAGERNGRFSPDGKSIAYQSDESGRVEVYVQPFPGTPDQRQRVSLNGGTNPQWGRKGRELYFVSADNRLMVATATPSGEKGALEFATPKQLIKSPLPQGAEYDTAQDGDRFLILAPVGDPSPIIVLNNWAPAAK